MTPSFGLTMITLAGAALHVHWQGQAGVTQQVIAVSLIAFYVLPQTAMNVAIQQRARGRKGLESKAKEAACVCFVRTDLGKAGTCAALESDLCDRGGVSCLGVSVCAC